MKLDSMLSCRKLTVGYAADHPVLSDVELEVRRGEIVALLGGSGSGKSTLLRTITALEEVDKDKTHWVGRIALELTLTDPKTGEVVWAQPYEEIEPLPMQNPEGLARAISTALDRIAQRAAPEIAERAAAVKPVAAASK